ncbi:response regulator [Thiohalobacter thiocyanaticus]|uniref:Response regulator n=1 Tax=Thiohalobacter thiocyanaticus TaxID=585455 RepID=A0A1Z4VM04_9GAMM|nr:hypothetical protein [Thiohalobacter thiocyanaticus]BAZ92641.1 response regulator [Thiohalobacter thiocyanaticus]
MCSHKPSDRANLYEHVCACGLEQKLIRLAVAKAGLSHSLWDDAAQEIRIAWLGAEASADYSMGETASYAHRIAFTTALKLRRDLGGAVRLPGSAFRFRSDGTQYAKPGHLAAPIVWDALPEELQIDESILSNDDDGMPWYGVREAICSEHLGPIDHNEAVVAIRTALTRRQRRLIELLSEGRTFTQIEYTLGIAHNSLMRNFRIIREKLKSHHRKDKN